MTWRGDTASMRLALDDEQRYADHPTLRLSFEPEPARMHHDITATRPAAELAGKRVRMRSTVRVEALSDFISFWLEAERQHETLVLDNDVARPILDTEDWTVYEIVIDVPVTATTLELGVWCVGRGRVWLGDIALDAVGPEVPTTGP